MSLAALLIACVALLVAGVALLLALDRDELVRIRKADEPDGDAGVGKWRRW